MNRDAQSDIRPDTEVRVAAAMRTLAETHIPDPGSIEPGGARSWSSSRWMLAVAASAVLVVGLGALLVASNRGTDSASNRLPVIDVTITSGSPAGSLPAVEPVTFSGAPLGNDIVPVIVPAPAQPVQGFDIRGDLMRWTRGIENATQFAVVEGTTVVGSIQVFDTPAPWDTMTDGQNVVEVGGREAIRIDGSDERGFFVPVGSGTRAVLDTAPPSQALAVDTDLAALVQLLGDGPLDRFKAAGRFVRVPVVAEFGRSISYGSQGVLQLLQVRMEPDAGEGSIDLVTQVYRLFIDAANTAQVSAVVQVSPVDLVVIVASNEENLTTATSNLQLVSTDQSGVDFSTYTGFTSETLVARGEPSWGRWQVTTGSDDAECQLFDVTVWSVDAVGRGSSDCGERNPVRADGSRVFCATLEVEIVGAVVGATTPPAVAVGDDIDGLAAELEATSTEISESTTFRIAQTEPGANIRAATVLVDGVEVDCSG